jgi:beta-glucanase (GH16 family)
MAKKPKYLVVLSWGVIIVLLVTSQAGRAALVVTRDANGVSSETATPPAGEENVPTKHHPRYPETAKVSLNTNKSSLLVSSGAFLPVGTNELTGSPGAVADWILTFSDEFDGESLNSDNWATEYGLDTYCTVDNPPPSDTPTYCNRSNNDEKEWYVDESPTVEAGVLKLIASINDCSGDGLPDRSYAPYTCANFPYLSGMVSTHDRFSQLYGYFEARIKLVNGQGFWPSFWLIPQLPPIPNPDVEYFWPPEIDIMENKGQEPNVIYMTHHYSGVYPEPGNKLDNWSYGGYEGSVCSGPDYSAGFHTYAVEWQPGVIIWYIDGIEVDYVHVYQKASPPLAEFTSNSPLNLEDPAIFTNSSLGTEPLSFIWDFGDTFTSTLRNPTHKYAAAGHYTVTLTATNNDGSDTVSHDFVVRTANTTIYLPWITKELQRLSVPLLVLGEHMCCDSFRNRNASRSMTIWDITKAHRGGQVM